MHPTRTWQIGFDAKGCDLLGLTQQEMRTWENLGENLGSRFPNDPTSLSSTGRILATFDACRCSLAVNATWTPTFYGYDGHGSVRQLTNSAGSVTDTYDFDAFGNLINSTASTPNNYLFAGEQYDPALGLYYNRARYLNTATGRFWSMDTDEGEDESPLSLHKYLYVQGDPVDGIDPSGYTLADILYGQRVHDEIGAAFLKWTGGPPLGLYDPTIKQVLGRSVPGFSRFRPDLVDIRTNEVYEIKPASASVLGYQQLAGYLIILNLSDPVHRLWIPGETFQPPDLPTTIELDPKTVALVDPPLLGLITYEVLNANELLAWGTLTVAGAMAAAEADLELSVGVATLNTSLAPGAP
jgi:RHS repeat-associated protein